MNADELMNAFADLIAEKVTAKFQPKRTPQRLLSVKEAAVYLGRSVSSLRHDGEIPRVRAGKSVRYLQEDLDAWIHEKRR